ncbi:TPA: hypothetical protein ACKQCL_005001, partial [Serratia marcescens]
KNTGQNQKRLAGNWPHFVKPITPDKRVFRFESSRVNALAIRSPLTKQPIEIASPKRDHYARRSLWLRRTAGTQ